MRDAQPDAPHLARRLILHEAAKVSAPADAEQAVLRAFEKLRTLLAKLVGAAGFRSLLGRALILAQRETPWLAAVHVKDDGALAGFGDGAPTRDAVAQGAVALLSQFLALLFLCIGEALTWRLVRDVWPDAPLDDLQPAGTETPR